MDSWASSCPRWSVHAVRSSAPFAEIRLFGSGVRQLDTGSAGCLYPWRTLCHGFLPHQRDALFWYAYSYVGSRVRRLRATRGLCHRHIPSCTRGSMDYRFQHAVTKQSDGQDSHLPVLAQPSRCPPLHSCRIILYCHNYYIAFIKQDL